MMISLIFALSLLAAVSVVGSANGIDGLCNDIHQHESDSSDHVKVNGFDCDRKCNGERYHCHFEFNVHHGWLSNRKSKFSLIQTQCPSGRNDTSDCCSGDGNDREITVISDHHGECPRYPGPEIYVCEGDIVTVKMHNDLETGSSTIHWHGLHMKSYEGKGEGTQWADGVPYITQCPTAPGDVFNYRFYAVPSGTYWYHSHMAHHADDGAFGALVVRDQPNGPTIKQLEPSYKEYLDEICDMTENRIMVTDSYDVAARTRYSSGWQPPTNILVNGKGRRQEDNVAHPTDSNVPWNIFTIDKEVDQCSDKKYYRFRIIGTQSLDCNIMVTMDDIKFTVIATDGVYVEPKEVTSLVVTNGERFDVVIPADAPIAGKQVYIMRFGGLDACARNKYSAIAYIRYGEADVDLDGYSNWTLATGNPGPTLNGYGGDVVHITDLKAVVPNEHTGPADKTFYIQFTPRHVGHKSEQVFNNVAYLPHLQRRPLLSQDHELNSEDYCPPGVNQGDFEINPATISNCYNVIEVDVGDVVEIFYIAPGPTHHPIHMHGGHFQIIAHGAIANASLEHNYVSWIKEIDANGEIHRNLDHPVLKDSFMSATAGWHLTRFYADNPGYWFTHCHNNFHHLDGMAFVIKVGSEADYTIPNGFPTCGNFDTCSAIA